MKNLIIAIGLFCLLVFLTTCKKEPDPYSVYDNGETIIPNITKVLSDVDFNSSLLSIDSINYTLTFKNTAVTSNINTGDIIISRSGEGLLRKVTSVNKGQDQVKIYTEIVSLSEAIKKADFDFGLNYSTKGSLFKEPEIEYIHDGVKLNNNLKGNSSIDELLDDISIDLIIDGDGNLQTLNDQIKITGTLSIDQNYNGNIVIDNFDLTKFYLEYNFVEQIDLSATYTLANIKLAKEIPFLKVTSKVPYVISVGPVPVVVTPQLILYAGVDISANSKITTSVNQSFNFKAGVNYEASTWTPFAQVNKTFSFVPPTLTASASAKVYVRPELSLKFYGFIVPSLSTPIYTLLSANIIENPWWSLKSGISGDIGITMEILSKKILDKNVNLFNISFPITQATGGIPKVPTVNTLAPGTITQTSAIIGGNVTDDGGATISDCGVFWSTSTIPELTGTKLKVGSGAGPFSTSLPGLKPNTHYYVKAYAINSIGTAYGNQLSFTTSVAVNNSPYAPSIPSPTNEAIGVSISPTLSWTCSDPDGDAMTYDIYFGTINNPTTIIASNQSASFIGRTELSANTTYFWKVIAKDSQGASTSGNIWSFTTTSISQPPTQFTNESYDLNNNLVPDGWKLEVPSTVVLLENGQLIAKTVDSYGYLRREGVVSNDVTKMKFEWDGNLSLTEWGMANYLQINFNNNSYVKVYLQTATANWGTNNNKLFFTYNSGSSEQKFGEWLVPYKAGTFHYSVTVDNNQIQFVSIVKSDNSGYVDQSMNIPSTIGFNLQQINSIDFIVNATTDNNNWLDNISVLLIK